ncbi:MAG: sugar phosphate nucleotidyltransferase, partial [Oscillospiraceae bacterium]
MQLDDLLITAENTVLEAMQKIDKTGRRLVFIAPENILKAVVTDSDIRRFILKGGKLTEKVSVMANYHPKSLGIEKKREAKAFLLEKAIDGVPLIDKNGKIIDVVFLGDIDTLKKGNLNLPVVIMAGGLGTRLYPYTKILPKPLIPIGELPIAEHIINRFFGYGCTDFSMVVNYKKSMIKSYFADIN